MITNPDNQSGAIEDSIRSEFLCDRNIDGTQLQLAVYNIERLYRSSHSAQNISSKRVGLTWSKLRLFPEVDESSTSMMNLFGTTAVLTKDLMVAAAWAPMRNAPSS